MCTIHFVHRLLRLLKHAIELGKPVMLLNLGPTRAHDVPKVEIIEAGCREVLRGATRALTSEYVVTMTNRLRYADSCHA
jgi:hypothetical protein